MSTRILVIEDEAAINDLICMNLEVAGYETDSFLDGLEASEALRRCHDYGCALVDVMLPGRSDGLDDLGAPVYTMRWRGERQRVAAAGHLYLVRDG